MILALALGKSLHEIRAMDVADVNRLRRFYARHPFGLLRGDLQAFMAGSQARMAMCKKGLTAREALSFCDYNGALRTRSQKRRQRCRDLRQRLPATRITPDKMKAMCMAAGVEIVQAKAVS